MYAAISPDLRAAQMSARRGAPRPRAPGHSLSRQLAPGQHLFFESDPARFIYTVRSGVLRLTRTQRDGGRQVIAFGFPGDIVGLPCDGRHTTECDAITPADVSIRRSDPLDHPEADPKLHSMLVTAALDEIRFLQDHFLILGRRRASEKVASFLVLLLDRVGEPMGERGLIRLPMNRSDIADYLGLTPETVSRSITQLRAEGLIKLDDPNTIMVRDAGQLRALAEGASERAAGWS